MSASFFRYHSGSSYSIRWIINAIQRITRYPLDKSYQNVLSYPPYKDLSSGQRCLPFEHPGPGHLKFQQLLLCVAPAHLNLRHLETNSAMKELTLTTGFPFRNPLVIKYLRAQTGPSKKTSLRLPSRLIFSFSEEDFYSKEQLRCEGLSFYAVVSSRDLKCFSELKADDNIIKGTLGEFPGWVKHEEGKKKK